MSGLATDTELTGAFAVKFSAVAPWSDADARLLQLLHARRRRLDANQILISEDDAKEDVFLIQRGWSCVYKLLSDGTRQIVYFPLPGDIVGFSHLMIGKAAMSLECLSAVVVSPISASTIKTVLSSDTKVAQSVLWALEQDRVMMMEHLVSVGRRSALVRTAHLILEFAERLRLVGVRIEETFHFPISQGHLADALGLTAIHVNRVLRQLRETKLVTLRAGQLTIHDFGQLAALAAFDPDYLTPPHVSRSG